MLCQEPAFPPLHQTALRDFCESNTSCAGGRFLRSHDWIQFDHIATCKFELYWEKSQEPAVIFFFFCVRVCVFELCHKIQQWWWWGNQVAACLQNRSETSIIETFTMQACRFCVFMCTRLRATGADVFVYAFCIHSYGWGSLSNYRNLSSWKTYSRCAKEQHHTCR